MITLHAPLGRLAEQRPGLWADVESAALEYHAGDRDTRLFLPLADWRDLAPDITPALRQPWTASAATLGPWRYTQRVYRIDVDLARELVATPMTGEVPVQVFDHLSDYALYLPLPDPLPMPIGGRSIVGAWASIGDTLDGRSELRQLRVLLDTGDATTVPVAMPLTRGVSVLAALEALNAAAAESRDQLAHAALDPILHRAAWDAAGAAVTRVLPLLMFLCVDEPEIRALQPPGGFGHQVDVRMMRRRGLRIFAPAGPRVVEVGRTYGDAIRSTRPHEPGTYGRGVAPHVRRGYWGLRWTGPFDGERVPVLRWIMPTIVGARES